MHRSATLVPLVLCCLALPGHASSPRSVAELAELAAVGPVRAQMTACSSLYPQQGQQFTAALEHFSALVTNSLSTLHAERAAECRVEAPDALFMHQEGLVRLYEAESQALTAERCQFLARDILTMSPVEFHQAMGSLVSDLAKASSTYREGMERALP